MAKKTEKRILKAALSCFNESGYFHVTLQQIANAADMSVGNLAYHFPNKLSILSVLMEDWITQWQLLLTDLHLTPIFDNLNKFLQATYSVQKEYQFIYTDQLALIRKYEAMKNHFQDYFQSHHNQLEILMELYLARGVVDQRGQSIDYIACLLYTSDAADE